MSYRLDGAKRTLAFGTYPAVSLLDARKQREKARGLINEGINPSQAKRIDKELKKVAAANTFEAIAREWHQHKIDTWQPSTAKNAMQRLETDVSHKLANELLRILKRAWSWICCGW